MSDYDFLCRYDVDDGYAGGSRLQTFSVAGCEIEDDMDEAAMRQLFSDRMQDDFTQKVLPRPMNDDAFVEWAHEILQTRAIEE